MHTEWISIGGLPTQSTTASGHKFGDHGYDDSAKVHKPKILKYGKRFNLVLYDDINPSLTSLIIWFQGTHTNICTKVHI